MEARRMQRAVSGLWAVLLVGCATAGPVPRAPLYERLGGKPAITAVVRDFLGRVAADRRINARFTGANLPRLEAMLIDQICQAAGGPCRYTGRDMKSAHAGMRIAGADFEALVEDLVATLDHFRVPAAEKGELLAVLGPMKPDIVEGPGAGATAGGAPSTTSAGPVAERAEGLREAAHLLDKADVARRRGDRSLADQLFSSAELIVGGDALAALATLFRDGAPPRITSPPVAVARDAPPQPAAVGSSAEDEPEPPRPARATLRGTVSGVGADGFVVVTLEPVGGRAPRRPPRRRVIEQRNREFAPRVLAVPVGSTVSFPNFDPIYHNVFSRSEARPFDLGLYKSHQARELVFDREGVVRVGCNLHANMSATVVVVSAPHYAITDRHGRFSFRSLEPGRYRLRAYSERAAEPTLREITVGAGEDEVAVALGASTPLGPLADKFGVPRGGKDPR
jgi:hemoglobin